MEALKKKSAVIDILNKIEGYLFSVNETLNGSDELPSNISTGIRQEFLTCVAGHDSFPCNSIHIESGDVAVLVSETSKILEAVQFEKDSYLKKVVNEISKFDTIIRAAQTISEFSKLCGNATNVTELKALPSIVAESLNIIRERAANTPLIKLSFYPSSTNDHDKLGDALEMLGNDETVVKSSLLENSKEIDCDEMDLIEVTDEEEEQEEDYKDPDDELCAHRRHRRSIELPSEIMDPDRCPSPEPMSYGFEVNDTLTHHSLELSLDNMSIKDMTSLSVDAVDEPAAAGLTIDKTDDQNASRGKLNLSFELPDFSFCH